AHELKLKYSQASITSDDKGMQCPSEDELQQPTKTAPKDEAKSEFGHEVELLDISMSDDELQLHAKLSDRKKEHSSRDSSYNSMPSGDRSSTCSISSYEPSERFYRRTKAIDDDEDDGDEDDAAPMSYKRHVARLAERALRACTNYYSESIKLNPELDQALNKKVEMLYNSEMRFSTMKR
ncbi:hypothetical protein KR093_004235, partial [Drosophila rubida]